MNKYLVKIAASTEKYLRYRDIPKDEANRAGVSSTWAHEHIGRKYGHEPLSNDELEKHYGRNFSRSEDRGTLEGSAGAAVGAAAGYGSLKALEKITRGRVGTHSRLAPASIVIPTIIGAGAGAIHGVTRSNKNQINESHAYFKNKARGG